MGEWIVIGERKDRNTIRRVFWTQKNKKSMPRFTCHENEAVIFNKQKAIECLKYLMHEELMDDGFLEQELCRLGSDRVSDIKIKKVKQYAYI